MLGLNCIFVLYSYLKNKLFFQCYDHVATNSNILTITGIPWQQPHIHSLTYIFDPFFFSHLISNTIHHL